MNIMGWFWFIIAAIISAVYFLYIKYLNKSHQWIYLIPIIGLGFLIIYAYYNALNYSTTGIAYGIIKAMSIIIVVIGGVIFFQDHLSIINIFGISIIAVGVIMASI